MSLTIRHDHQDGTLLEGSRKGDGVYEIVRPLGFAYFPSIRAIGIRNSRDRVADRYRINRAAEALRAAGHEVEVVIDDAIRDRAEVEAARAERLEQRRDRLEASAERHQGLAQQARQRSDALVEHIPFGQPILVGHHSERTHRNTLRKSQDAMFRSLAEGRVADEQARRADRVGFEEARRHKPGPTLRRIDKAQADLRRIERSLKGDPISAALSGGATGKPATGDWRESLLARKAQLEDQLAHDRALIDAAVANGAKVYGPQSVHVGDEVAYWYGQRDTVLRVNPKSVTVPTPYSWTNTVRYDEIKGVTCPHTEGGTA